MPTYDELLDGYLEELGPEEGVLEDLKTLVTPLLNQLAKDTQRIVFNSQLARHFELVQAFFDKHRGKGSYVCLRSRPGPKAHVVISQLIGKEPGKIRLSVVWTKDKPIVHMELVLEDTLRADADVPQRG